ncbi:MAG: class I SAM-dependent methyltransferase [Chloroflexota bacterium]
MSDFLTVQTQSAWRKTLFRFAEWCAPSPGWRTLDVGCGPGLLPAYFGKLGCQAYGVDLDEGGLQYPLHHQLACADALALPFAEKCFELVSMTNLLFLLEHPLEALLEARRVLVEGGILCTLNPSEHLTRNQARETAERHALQGADRESLLNWAARAEQGQRWNEAETAQLFRTAGFACVETILKMDVGLARFSRGILRA